MSSTATHDPETNIPVTTEAVRKQELKDVESLTNDLKHLLVRHEKTLNEEGIRKEVATLEHWMESYRGGLAAANKISETGMGWLLNLRNHLKLAVEEMQRLEGEGGNPAGKEQAEKMEDLLRAIERIDSVIPDFEHMFSRSPEAEPEDA